MTFGLSAPIAQDPKIRVLAKKSFAYLRRNADPLTLQATIWRIVCKARPFDPAEQLAQATFALLAEFEQDYIRATKDSGSGKGHR